MNNPNKKFNSFKDFLNTILKEGSDLIGFGEGIAHGIHTSVFNELSKYNHLFKGIFLELPQDYQTSIDYYLQSGIFDQKINNFMAAGAKEGNDTSETDSVILNSARLNKLPVWCVDSRKTLSQEYTVKSRPQLGNWFMRGKSRDEDMFTSIMSIRKEAIGPWYFVGGTAHAQYGVDYRGRHLTLGENLKRKIGNKYFNIYMEKNSELQKSVYFIAKDGPTTEIKNLLMLGNYYSNLDSNGNSYFDAYIFHP